MSTLLPLVGFAGFAAVSSDPRACITGALLPHNDYQQECDDFCTGKCSFFNVTRGEHGFPENKTLYRLTPTNVTGVRNKDTGDAPGDVSFFLSKKNLTQQCAADPTSWGCFLDGTNIYGRFGPYFVSSCLNNAIEQSLAIKRLPPTPSPLLSRSAIR